MKFVLEPRGYANKCFTIKDIDVKPEETVVNFDIPGHEKFSDIVRLRNVFKQFPNVQTLIIGPNILNIEISNLMFPNVKKVISRNKHFASNVPYLIEIQRKDRILKNVFFKGKDESIDMADITKIGPYVFEGCMSTDFVNISKNLIMYDSFQQNVLSGSMFVLKESKEGIVAFNDILLRTNAPDVIIPNSIHGVYQNACFEGLKTIRMYNTGIFTRISKSLSAYKNASKQELHVNAYLDIKGSSPTVNTLCNILMSSAFDSIDICTEKYISVDGILYSRDKKVLIKCPLGYNRDTVTIPDGVEYIMEMAFISTNIKSVVISDSVQGIGTSAFYGSQIEHVSFGKGLSYIPERAFACTKLEEVEIPGNIKMIGEDAFANNNRLQKIILYEGIESILTGAFYDRRINHIEFPPSLNYLGTRAFYASYDAEPLTVKVKKKLPQNFVSAFAFQYTSDIKTQMKPKSIKICYDDGRQVIIPDIMRNVDIEEMNKEFNAGLIEYRCYYDKAILSETRQDMALDYLHDGHQNDKEIVAYLRHTAKNIAKRYVNSNDSKRLIKFVELGFLTGQSLDSILKLANEAGMTTASAYILRKLENMSKSTFRL